MTRSISSSYGDVRLKRELGLFSAINMVLAVMIGSGIFISPASALEHSGSVAMCILIWTICGIVSLFGALAYAELGTVVPRSGAEYAYFIDSYGPLHPFWGKLPAFINSWVLVIALRPAEVAVIMLTFSEYTCQPLFHYLRIDDETSQMHVKKMVTLISIGLITYINICSVKLYVQIQNIFGFFKVLACLLVIGAGVYEVSVGNVQNLQKGFEGTKSDAKNIALAFYSGLWAYDGWNAITCVTEEVKAPEKNIFRSIAISVPIVTLLYVFMNISYLTVLTIPEMINAPAVAVNFGERVLGSFNFLIPMGVAFSTFGCALSLQFGVTRICFVSSQDGHMADCLSYIHYKKLTPVPAVIMQAAIAIIYVVVGDIIQLLQFASFLVWIFYGCAMVSLLILRRTHPEAYRPYKVPIYIVVLVFASAIFLAVVPIVTDPTPKYLFAISFMLIGVIVYYWFVYKKRRLRIMNKISDLIQILFEVVPPQSKCN